MSQASTNEIKPGMKVKIDQAPYLVISNEFVKPGKGQAFNRIRIKNFLTGKVLEKTFKSGEKLELADVQETTMRLLYIEGHSAVFMNDNTFDQINVDFDVIKDNVKWLKDDTVYSMIIYNGNVIEIIPPTFMELKITETAPGLRGDTSGKVMKPATIETGTNIQIPIFVNEGETIKIDTRTGEYVSRVQ